MRLSAFRNPEGVLPDGMALAPWERPADVPPEKDGFFLLEMMPRMGALPAEARGEKREPVRLAILFDASLSVRWAGLETAYARLVRVLESLSPRDSFALVPFDRVPDGGKTLMSGNARSGRAQSRGPARATAGSGQRRGQGTRRGPPARRRRGATAASHRRSAHELGGPRGRPRPPPSLHRPKRRGDAGSLSNRLARRASSGLLGRGRGAVPASRRVAARVRARPAGGPPLPGHGSRPPAAGRLRGPGPTPSPGGLSGWIGRYGEPAERLRWRS